MLTITVYTWILVFSQPNPISTLRYFAFHPPLQTLAVLLFGIGILTLQPTSKSAPRAKERGLKIHQIIQLGLGVPCILFGSTMMILNKIDHGAAHFTTWHAVSQRAPLVVRRECTFPVINTHMHFECSHARNSGSSPSFGSLYIPFSEA